MATNHRQFRYPEFGILMNFDIRMKSWKLMLSVYGDCEGIRSRKTEDGRFGPDAD